MTQTIISSASKEVIIGFDQPFCVIGERINPTGRKKLAEEMAAGNMDTVRADALAQIEKGAHVLDVNAGIPLADEPKILADTIKLVQSLTDAPLCIDSSIFEALVAGLDAYEGRPLLNSVTGEEESLERILPLVKKYDCAVVAISNDETGISGDPNVRFEVAKKIVERAQDYGIKRDDVVVDPLVMPLGAASAGGAATDPGVAVLNLIHRLRSELKVNTTCGASNISFGLPNRRGVDAAFMAMAIGAGMTSAITNPLHDEIRFSIMAADALMAHDPDCARWVRANRAPSTDGDVGRGSSGRRGGGRRRRG